MKVLGFDFAPLSIPIERRLQTFAALCWVAFALGCALTSWLTFIWAIFQSPILRIPCIVYATWMYFDKEAILNGTRRSDWVRNWKWWQYFTAYFPVKLIKTAELPNDKSYLFTVFPHGILAIGPFCTFSTNACSFKETFPGLTPHIATLNMHFVTPFTREITLAMGNIPASEDCLLRKLSEKGNAVCLVVGGAEEAFHSKPGEYNILLSRRKGFIRVALKSGASLVPTISFGEPEVYDQIQRPPGSFLRWTQDWYKKLTGIAPVYLKGRGVFQYTYGLLPFRHPITLVTGKPIAVEKVATPTQEDIDKLHNHFSEKLLELYNNEKSKYLNVDIPMNVILKA